MIAAVNAAKADGVAAHYTTMRNLLTYLRQSFSPTNQSETFDERWHLLTTVPVLAIDELDKANTTPWALEQFSALVDVRWRKMHEVITLFALNAELDVLPGDVVDRVSDRRSYMVELNGASRRW